MSNRVDLLLNGQVVLPGTTVDRIHDAMCERLTPNQMAVLLDGDVVYSSGHLYKIKEVTA